MKRIFHPLAAIALIAVSCSTDTKDSQRTMTYYDYNMIVDRVNPDQKAQATYNSYELTLNFSKAAISLKTSDLIVNNQKMSFETDTMAYRSYYFKTVIDDQETTIEQITFSKATATGVGSAASNLKGSMLGMFVPATTDSLASTFKTALVERLDLSYTLSDRYNVQTFWPNSLYIGQTYSSDNQESLSTRATKYLVNINFPKEKATVFVYNCELSASDKTTPKVIRIGDIPVRFNHDSYYLEASNPKTTVLTKKNNVPMLIDSIGFQVEDFSLRITSDDMTDANISYKLKGKSVNFSGSCVPKPVY